MQETPANVIKRMRELEKEIRRHNHLYHTLDAPEISDEAYDSLLRSLIDLEAQYPEAKSPASPTQTVGSVVSSTLPVHQHIQPMYSLDNVFSLEEFSRFNKRRRIDLYGEINSDTPEIEWHVSPKYDGLAVALTYQHEVLVRAVTRGDGTQGEDITHQVRKIQGIPTHIKGNVGPYLMEIRGEVVMPYDVFKKANELRQSQNKPLFVNPRNAAAGVIRKKESDGITIQGLKFIAYDVILPSDINQFAKTHKESMDELTVLGFNTQPLMRQLLRGTAEVNTYYERLLGIRQDQSLSFDVDGIVLRINSHEQAARLGYTSKSPRFAVAFKFPAEERTSTVEDIVVQVGRTGKITPVAKIAPVFVGGVTVTSVTLHNESEVQRKDVRIGDVVIVRRAGDVVPEIVSVVASLRSDTKPWVLKEHYPTCPECNSDLERPEGDKDYRCTGALICPAQRIAAITHAFSRKALDVDGFGETIVTSLIEYCDVKCVLDVFKLSAEQFRLIPRMGPRLAKKLIDNLQGAKYLPLARFIYSLGIRHVGENTSRLLADYAARHRGEMDAFEFIASLDAQTLSSIDEVGPTVSQSIVTFFSNEELKRNALELNQLLQPTPPVISDTKAKNVNVVVTGSFEGLTREDIEQLVLDIGGKVSKSVSKKTTLVLVGEKPSLSKVTKAEQLGVEVVTPSDVAAFIASL